MKIHMFGADIDQIIRESNLPCGVKLPDGSFVPRIPGITRWMWDGQVCGSINFRWQVGSTELPPNCLGHIGYEVFQLNLW